MARRSDINETGRLRVEDGRYILLRDGGGRRRLAVATVPEEALVGHVRIVGTALSPDLVEVDALILL